MVLTLKDASDFTYGNGRSLTNGSRRKPLCIDIFPVDLLHRNKWPLDTGKMEIYYACLNGKIHSCTWVIYAVLLITYSYFSSEYICLTVWYWKKVYYNDQFHPNTFGWSTVVTLTELLTTFKQYIKCWVIFCFCVVHLGMKEDSNYTEVWSWTTGQRSSEQGGLSPLPNGLSQRKSHSTLYQPNSMNWTKNVCIFSIQAA